MSKRDQFKVSINLLIFHSSLFLFGIILASVFLRFSSEDLQVVFFHKFDEYYELSELASCAILILQECFWVLLIAFLSRFRYGRLFNFLILIYKGFGAGIISSIACAQLGISGIKYVFFLVMPPNLLYLSSLCIASQLSHEHASYTSGVHNRPVFIDRKVYLICFFLSIMGGIAESYYVPWIYNILF